MLRLHVLLGLDPKQPSVQDAQYGPIHAQTHVFGFHTRLKIHKCVKIDLIYNLLINHMHIFYTLQ
jgi:hypothetical protein